MTCRLLAAEILEEDISALLKNAPSPGINGLKKKVPAKIIDAKLGLFGIFAILKFEDQTRLGIFNIAQVKFQKMLKMKSTNFKYTTAGSLLLIYYPNLNIIEMWDLLTMKKIKEKKIKIDDVITNLEMASDLNSKVFVSATFSTKYKYHRFYGVLDLETLQLNKFKNDSLFAYVFVSTFIHIRCNKDMMKILVWSTSCNPSGFNYIDLSYIHNISKKVIKDYGSLNFADNDNWIIATNGFVLNSDGVALKKYSDSMLFPVVGDDFYIQYKLKSKDGEPNLIVRDINSHKKVTEFITDVKLKKKEFVWTDFTDDRQLLASRITDRMVLIDYINQSLRIYALGITRKGISFGNIPKAFLGEKWICKINYPQKTKIVIEDGPENMTFNADSNMLIWDKPTTEGTQDVLLSVIKPGEKEFYKEINIIVKKKSTHVK